MYQSDKRVKGWLAKAAIGTLLGGALGAWYWQPVETVQEVANDSELTSLVSYDAVEEAHKEIDELELAALDSHDTVQGTSEAFDEEDLTALDMHNGIQMA